MQYRDFNIFRMMFRGSIASADCRYLFRLHI